MKPYIQYFLPVIASLFIALSVHSCSKKTSMAQPVKPFTHSDTIKSYLALGDSYTIGQSVSEEERFPNQVLQILQNDSIEMSKPEIIAVTGWTTASLITALNVQPPKHDYSLVSLLIGVNNQYQGRNIDEYTNEFTLLLNRSIQYAGGNRNHVFVLSIPDYSVTPFGQRSGKTGIAEEIDSFNIINKTISSQLGVHYLDITAISREAINVPALIATDGLHPSGKQYKRWADLLAPMMMKSL